MAYELKERERKVLFWGALISVPVLLVSLVINPLRVSITDKRDELDLQRTSLARERAAIAAAKLNPGLQHAADSIMQITSTRLFTGTDDVLASAELGSYLAEIAGQHHVLVNTATTGAIAKQVSNVRTLTEDIRGESDLQGILEFLQALERGPKLVRVSRIDLSRPTRDADDIETILFSATVTAYALPPEPVTPATKVPAAQSSTRGGTP